jgi:hypothetical protein
MFDLAIYVNNFNIGSPPSEQPELAYAWTCQLRPHSGTRTVAGVRHSFYQSGSCRGGCEFETAELILRGGIAAYLSLYMSTKQEKKGTGNCS